MKISNRLLLVIALTAGSIATQAWAAQPKAPTQNSASADYPLTTCVVSGDDLEEMGHPFNYVYKQEGKPDRLVRFCCKDCVKDFKKDPAKYLSALDAAEAKKNKADAVTAAKPADPKKQS